MKKLKQFALIAFLALLVALVPAYPQLWAQTPENPQSQAAQLEQQAIEQRDRGELSAAAQSYRQLLELYQTLGETDEAKEALIELAKTTLLMEDYPQAIALFEQAIAKIGDSPQTLTNLGLAFFETGQQAQAEEALSRAIAVWDTLRAGSNNDDLDRVTLFEQQAHTYRLLQKVLVAQNKTDAALEIAEASRARSLVEQLAQANGATAPNPPTLSEIKQIAKAKNSTLVEYSIVGREVRVLGIEPQDETHLYIWAIKPSGEVAFRQVNLQAMGIDSIRNLVEQAREKNIGVEGRGLRGRSRNPKTHLQQLHQLLIEPIADLLPSDPSDRVTFVPQGPLFLVPFAALQDPQGQYLIHHHTPTITPSIQLLSLTAASGGRPTGNVLIVGNPTMPQIPGPGGTWQQLSPLPGTEEEARAIAAMFDTQAILGDEATEENIVQRMGNAEIIHFATHGLLDFDADLNVFGEVLDPTLPTARDSAVYANPGAIIVGDNVFVGGVPANIAFAREKIARVAMPGLLAFAPSPDTSPETEDRGFLSAKEITQLQLQAQLVVLSACDTGRGRITGDGVVGLARSFIAAGAQSTIVSLWAVPDMPTAELMTAFYRYFQQTPDKAWALRQAMLETLRQYPQPIDWAGFILLGEPE